MFQRATLAQMFIKDGRRFWCICGDLRGLFVCISPTEYRCLECGHQLNLEGFKA